jgi:hypothetical protein
MLRALRALEMPLVIDLHRPMPAGSSTSTLTISDSPTTT